MTDRPSAVFAVIFNTQGHLLLGKRSPFKIMSPGYWIPIAGRVETGESETAALIREVREEIDVKAVPVRKIAMIPSVDGSSDLHWWIVEIKGTPRIANDEFVELRWVAREELLQLSPMYPENLAILQTAFENR